MKKIIFLVCLLVFTKNVFALTCTNVVINANHMTEAQFDEYTETIKGAVIKCTGKITDVESNWFNPNYGVVVNIYNVGLFFDIDKNTALGLYKGNNYKFTGSIKRMYTILGNVNIHLRDVTIAQ